MLRRRLTIVAGKGGVGKTTVACALATFASQQRNVLLLSTDPAHSLSECLATEVDTVPTTLGPRLWAQQIDPGRTFDAYLGRIRPALHAALDRGTYFDDQDITALLALPLPGIDEVTALLELARLLERSDWDQIVLDTAPTGHTERLLRLPLAFAEFGDLLDAMQERHRFMVNRLARHVAREPDQVEQLIAEMQHDAARLRALLHDPASTDIVLVGTNEPVVVAETRRYFDWLHDNNLAPRVVVLNRMQRDGSDEASVVPERVLPDYDVTIACAPEFRRAPRGALRLRCLGVLLATGWRPGERRTRQVPANAQSETGMPFPLSQAALQCVVGKGGAGKTTVASLEALALAVTRPVLLLSLDPAHSVGDVWGVMIGDTAVKLAANLWGQEIDAAQRWTALRSGWQTALAEATTDAEQARLPGWADTLADLERMLDLMPPGIDEIMGLFALLDLWEQGTYQTIVVDSAPTGHLLRLIGLPELALAWVQMFMRLLLKYREVVRLTTLAEELIGLSRRLKMAAALLRDPQRCGFLPVTLAAALDIAETGRLIQALEQAGMPVVAVVLNRMHASQDRGQSHYARHLEMIVQAPVYRLAALTRPPIGADTLHALLGAP